MLAAFLRLHICFYFISLFDCAIKRRVRNKPQEKKKVFCYTSTVDLLITIFTFESSSRLFFKQSSLEQSSKKAMGFEEHIMPRTYIFAYAL